MKKQIALVRRGNMARPGINKRKIGENGWLGLELFCTQKEYEMWMALGWREKDDISRRISNLIENIDVDEIEYEEGLPRDESRRIYLRVKPEAWDKFMAFPRRGRSSWLRKNGLVPFLRGSLLLVAC